MRKHDFLKLGSAAIAGWLASSTLPKPARSEETNGDDAITGLWQMTVNINAAGAAYHYLYAIGRNAWTCTGDIDENYMGYRFSPTMGAYTRLATGAYKYRERGWVFDLKGTRVGSFESRGTLNLSADGNTLTGPGTWTQFDTKGKSVARESFTATATRLLV